MRRPNKIAGTCPKSGCDVRATPARCPESGTIAVRVLWVVLALLVGTSSGCSGWGYWLWPKEYGRRDRPEDLDSALLAARLMRSEYEGEVARGQAELLRRMATWKGEALARSNDGFWAVHRKLADGWPGLRASSSSKWSEGFSPTENVIRGEYELVLSQVNNPLSPERVDDFRNLLRRLEPATSRERLHAEWGKAMGSVGARGAEDSLRSIDDCGIRGMREDYRRAYRDGYACARRGVVSTYCKLIASIDEVRGWYDGQTGPR